MLRNSEFKRNLLKVCFIFRSIITDLLRDGMNQMGIILPRSPTDWLLDTLADPHWKLG